MDRENQLVSVVLHGALRSEESSGNRGLILRFTQNDNNFFFGGNLV